MGGKNKAFLQLGSKQFLDCLLETLSPLTDDILLVARDPALFSEWGLRTVPDIHRVRCALTGLHAGLAHCRTSHAFVAACDAPLLQPSLARGIMQQATQDIDAVVPEYEGYLEPLCAVYSTSCLPHAESMLQRGIHQIRRLYPLVRTRKLGPEFIRSLDPDMDSFVNVNTDNDLQILRQRAGIEAG